MRNRTVAVILAGTVLAAAISVRAASTRPAPSVSSALVGTVPTRHFLVFQTENAEARVEIYGWSHEVLSPRDAASGLPTGKRQHAPVVVVKPVDAASAPLLSQFLQAGTLDRVRVESLRQATRNGSAQPYLAVEMMNVLITSYQAVPEERATRRGQGHEVREHVAFTYQKITWTLPDGTQLSDTWELDP